MGKGIGNQTHCQMCNKELTDPASIEHGLGSKCWPSFQDHLAKEAPRCESEIQRLQTELAKTHALTFEQWMTKRGYDRIALRRDDPEWLDQLRKMSWRETENQIAVLKRQLADAEGLLAAARRWNASPVAA